MCATQGRYFVYFWAILRMSKFALLTGLEDAEISQKHMQLFPLVADIFDLNKFV